MRNDLAGQCTVHLPLCTSKSDAPDTKRTCDNAHCKAVNHVEEKDHLD